MLPDRFTSKLSGWPGTGCWTWQRALRDGYGAFHDGRMTLAHRYAYELLVAAATCAVLILLVLAALGAAGHQIGIVEDDDPFADWDADVLADDALIDALAAGAEPHPGDELERWLADLRDDVRSTPPPT